MAVRRLAETQPESFAFSAENRAWAEREIAKFPEGRQASAVISLLWRAQEQEGWVTKPAIECVATMLGMPLIRVLEVATFYTMFHLEPMGDKAHVQVCGTTPCMLRGAGEIIDVCRRRINAEPHHRSADGAFSWEEVECLGACVNAPMVLIHRDTYEDLTPGSFEAVLDALAEGRKPKPGPQDGRQYSMPITGATSLTDIKYSKDDVPPAPRNGAAVAAPSAAIAAAPVVSATAETATAEARPQGIAAPRGGVADDLKRISGIGPASEKKLNALGIWHFDQMAAWSPAELAWVGDYLAFHGRIEREDWIGQAHALAAESDKSEGR